MTEPDIAVLMPVYNPGPELELTLASLRAQHVPFRLYIVDDGSRVKPDYRALTHGMDCKIITLPQNVGIIGALNAGVTEILKKQHSYISRLDNGDMYASERLEKQHAYLESHPDICMLGSAIQIQYQTTGITITSVPALTPEQNAIAVRYNSPVPGATLMFRTSFMREVGGFPTAFPAAEDYALEWLVHHKGYKMVNMPEVLYTSVEMLVSISGGQRVVQLKSRLRLQLKYADWLNHHTYLGLARTLLLMALPVNMIRRLKSALGW